MKDLYETCYTLKLSKLMENKQNNVSILPNSEVLKQTADIMKFLLNTHTIGDKERIEIRALYRNPEVNNSYFGSFTVTDFNDYNKKQLYEFLSEINKERVSCCIYYSVYCYTGTQNRINSKNASSTNALVADFDHISKAEYDKIYTRFIDLNIVPNYSIFSGHGFQTVWIIDKSYDTDLLNRFTSLLIQNGFPVDPSIKDSARIMRMPFTNNCKELATNDGSTIRTYIYKQEKIQSRPYQQIFNNLQQCSSCLKEVEVKNNIKTENAKIGKSDIIKIYNFNKQETFPEHIFEMLKGFRPSEYNNMHMYLVLFFKNRGYSLEKINDIMLTISKMDTYNYSYYKPEFILNETKRFYNSNYSIASFRNKFTSFGNIDFDNSNIGKLKISNYIFEMGLNSKMMFLYVAMLLDSESLFKSQFTINDLSNLINRSECQTAKTLNELCNYKVKLVDKKSNESKQKGCKYTYRINGYSRKSNQGFTMFDISFIKYLINLVLDNEISETEMAICLYIKKCLINNDTLCLSQETIGSKIGVSQQHISRSIKNCVQKNIIVATKVEYSKSQFRYDYYVSI